MAIYRTDDEFAKRAALAKALREYADVVEQGAPVASSVYWADTPRDPRPLPSSLHITMEQINITFPPASFWRAAIVPYSDPNAPDSNRREYFFVQGDKAKTDLLNEIKVKIASVGGNPDAVDRTLDLWALDPKKVEQFQQFAEGLAAEQQAAGSTLPPWRDRLQPFEMAQLALAEAYSHDLQTIPDETRGTHGKALKTIAALVQILDERE